MSQVQELFKLWQEHKTKCPRVRSRIHRNKQNDLKRASNSKRKLMAENKLAKVVPDSVNWKRHKVSGLRLCLPLLIKTDASARIAECKWSSQISEPGATEKSIKPLIASPGHLETLLAGTDA